VSNEISPNHVSSKLVLLTIHFPRLRILWCSSCAETADIFDELKSGCQQPNATDAMAIKTDQVADDNDDIKYNPVLKVYYYFYNFFPFLFFLFSYLQGHIVENSGN
jgi:ERCC4-type nuclease